MKKSKKKLELQRQTLRALTSRDLYRVEGAGTVKGPPSPPSYLCNACSRADSGCTSGAQTLQALTNGQNTTTSPGTCNQTTTDG